MTLLEDLQALGIAFASLNEGIDTTRPTGRLKLHILGAIAEFERTRIAERVMAGLQRARAQRLGRPRKAPLTVVVPGGATSRASSRNGASGATTMTGSRPPCSR